MIPLSFFILACVACLVVGSGATREYYKLRISETEAKHNQLIARMRKTELFILKEVLQLSPDEIEALLNKAEKEENA